ncbi:hypothetical protein TNCV_4209191 [Trichonephila clavipes]|nr:hypothetical protein TNCV_4209191 [Trichonephila clavipes]
MRAIGDKPRNFEPRLNDEDDIRWYQDLNPKFYNDHEFGTINTSLPRPLNTFRELLDDATQERSKNSNFDTSRVRTLKYTPFSAENLIPHLDESLVDLTSYSFTPLQHLMKQESWITEIRSDFGQNEI